MAAEDVWFGNTERFQLVQAPASISTSPTGYSEFSGFEGGGGAGARSVAHQQRFNFTYPWTELSDDISAEVFTDYAAGVFGSGLVQFADPMVYDRNLFPVFWSDPRVFELDSEGWPNIGHSTPSWGNTAANSFQQPARKGTWTITTAANATPLTDTSIPFVIIPIHPSYTLHLGVTGAATGTAVVRVESWVNGAAAAGATASLTLLSETGSTRLNATVAGSTYAYAKVYLSRTSAAASTITPISMMAQLHLTGSSPTLTGVHLRGKGHGGLMFDGVPDSEYLDASDGRHYKALSVSFREVGPWV